ncbi:hypothetical protein P8452_55260 [Trifolium repens]|nr:hypothetical protein P8452_55260 [Trifolium repens]
METESNEAHAVDSPIFLNIITNKESNQAQINGESNSSYVLEMSQRSSIQESTSDVEFHSPTLENVMVLDNDVGQESKQWDQEIGCMTHEQIMSLNSAVMHDEAIGIITMEDLMEELLQVLGGIALQKGVEYIEDRIVDDVVERVEDDLSNDDDVAENVDDDVDYDDDVVENVYDDVGYDDDDDDDDVEENVEDDFGYDDDTGGYDEDDS